MPTPKSRFSVSTPGELPRPTKSFRSEQVEEEAAGEAPGPWSCPGSAEKCRFLPAGHSRRAGNSSFGQIRAEASGVKAASLLRGKSLPDPSSPATSFALIFPWPAAAGTGQQASVYKGSL